MEILTGAASSTLSEISKWVWSIAVSNINYILCYDRKVEKLKHLVQELDIKKKVIQQEVYAAKRNGRTVSEDVSQWLTTLNDVEKDARRLEDKVKGMRRFMGCCWDCFSSYKIGKEVVEKIATANKLLSTHFTSFSHEPSPPSIESQYPNRHFHESSLTKSSMDHIWEALNNEKNYIIGVYGMGGVGKTTIMKEVAKRAKNEGQYNHVIMVTVSQKQDVKRMQTEIADQLGLQLTAEFERVRGGKIFTILKGAGKILIILDDLWGSLDISQIGIPIADQNKECKVVITTRSRDVCSSMECQQLIQVEPLSPKESWVLFKSKVGDVLEKTNLREVAVDVAKECGGLPLAIITLGRALRDKDDISTWIALRTELRQPMQTHIKGMEDSVFKCIRRSFDYLSSDESGEAKLCFLLCSLFPKDWEIDIVDFFRYVVGEGILWHGYSMEEAWNRVWWLLHELKDCCLLLEGADSEHFRMHDVVRDVAVWISSHRTYGFYGFTNKGLRRWPKIEHADECRRISFMGNSLDSLPEQLVFPELRTLIFNETGILTSVPDGFFRGMEALLVLDLRTKKVVSLPSSLSCLVNLKALFLSGRHARFDATGLSLVGELKGLEVLQLEDFEFGTVPKEFGNLTSLRCLDLLGCTGTIPRNLISRLCRLEQLYLTDVFSDWQVDDDEGSGGAATFAELASLSYLTTLHVDIENPDVFLQQQEEDDLAFGPWPALTDFNIVVGTRILPISFEPGRRRSKQLVITRSTYHSVIDLATKTEVLYLHNWSGMECLFSGADREGFAARGKNRSFQVRELHLHDMPDMTSLCAATALPDDVLRNLTELEIRKCHRLIVVLPASMLLRTHRLMRRVVVESCDRLQKVLSLNLVQEGGGAGIVLLPRLERIRLRDLPELRSVWDIDGVTMLPGSLQNLRSVYLRDLPELRGVWDDGVTVGLQNLESLYVDQCKSLRDVFPRMLRIPNGVVVDFPSLRELEIVRCDSLAYLLSWRRAGRLPSLESLTVGFCVRMEAVVKAKSAADDDNDDDDESLAGAAQLLPRLSSIQLYNLRRLTSFCRCLEYFPSLQRLEISGCDSLTYLLSWRQAKGLPRLQTLSVSDCEIMEAVIFKGEEEEEEEAGGGGATADHHKYKVDKEEESRHVLPSLTNLTLKWLPMLRSLSLPMSRRREQSSKSLSSLKNLHVVECPKMKKLPLSSSSPVDLEYLSGGSWEWEDKSIKERLRTFKFGHSNF